jgi:hypothetical protein
MAMCEGLLHRFESTKDDFLTFGMCLKNVVLPKF